MEFALTDEQRMIAETAQAFFRERADDETTRAAMAVDGFDRALWAASCAELGLGGVLIGEAHGGSDMGMVEFASIAQAAGARIAAIPLLGMAMAARAIGCGGTEVQQARWLPGIAAGDIVATFAFAADLVVENGCVSATVDYVPHGHVADVILLSDGARTMLIDAAVGGIGIERFETMDASRPLVRLTLHRVAAEPLGDGTTAASAAEHVGLLTLAAEAVGGADAALSATVDYAMQRKQFGRPIGSFQAVKHRLADRFVDLEQARSAMYWAACAIDEGDAELALAVHVAKSFCADMYFRCAGDMIQLHGGIGFTWEHAAHLFFKRARSIQTMLGDGAYHREAIAALILRAAA